VFPVMSTRIIKVNSPGKEGKTDVYSFKEPGHLNTSVAAINIEDYTFTAPDEIFLEKKTEENVQPVAKPQPRGLFKTQRWRTPGNLLVLFLWLNGILAIALYIGASMTNWVSFQEYGDKDAGNFKQSLTGMYEFFLRRCVRVYSIVSHDV